MKSNSELLKLYLNNPVRTIIFGKGPDAKAKADSFAAYAIEHNIKAVVVLDEQKKYFVAERDGRDPIVVMPKYTLESLKAINASYDSEHRMTQADVDIVNNLLEKFEARSRAAQRPVSGDCVEFTNKWGEFYPKALINSIDWTEEKPLYICTQGTANLYDANASLSTSGGPWERIPIEIERIGTVKKTFWTWGRVGARGNGGLYFDVEVNLWSYTDGEHKFTTRTHDRFYVYAYDAMDPRADGYKYQVSSGAMNYTAFRTEAEYKKWLKAYRGVEDRKSSDDRAWWVWTYKQKEVYVWELEDFMKLDGVIEETRFNGWSKTVCTQVYEGTTVTTYTLRPDKR